MEFAATGTDVISMTKRTITLQGINISHLGKCKIIFKSALVGGYVNSLEGILCTVYMRAGVCVFATVFLYLVLYI